MASLKKDFSIAKLYSDLEKYEANLIAPRDSKIKKQYSGSSLHQRPNSTHHKPYETRESFCVTNLNNFSKSKLEVTSKARRSRPTFQNFDRSEESSTYNYNHHNIVREGSSHNTSVLRESYLANRHTKENKPQAFQFKKSDEHLFLSECSKLYKLNQKDKKAMTPQEEENSVKILLNEIKKRDRVYDCVVSKFGSEDIEKKLISFFENYERLGKIVGEFKKMSKLDIQDDQQLYEFLISEEPEKIASKTEIEAALQGSN